MCQQFALLIYEDRVLQLLLAVNTVAHNFGDLTRRNCDKILKHCKFISLFIPQNLIHSTILYIYHVQVKKWGRNHSK